MRSIDYDAFTAQTANRWRAWATAKRLDPDHPIVTDLRKFYAERWPALATAEGEFWYEFLKALAEHGYQARLD